MLKNKKPLILALLLLLAGGGCYYYHQTEAVAAEEAAGEIKLSGHVDVREVSLAFRQSDRISEILVEEGDAVKAGQVLARLDPQELSLELARTRSQIERQEYVLLRLQNGTRQEEIGQSAAKVEAAEAELARAGEHLAKKQNAFQTSGGRSVSRDEVDTAEAQYRAQTARVDEARQAYNLAVAGPRSEDIGEAAAGLQELKDKLTQEEYILSQYELKSPSDGVIRSRLMEVGDMASPQQPVFKISLHAKKWVRAYVKERDLGRIYEGQTAEVFIDSKPDEPLTGQIGYISSTAEFSPKTVETEELRTSLLYEVRVYLDDPENVLRMGMPATIRVNFK